MGRVLINLSFPHFQGAVSQCSLMQWQPILKFVHLPRNAPTPQGSVPRRERNGSLLPGPPQPLLCPPDFYSAPPLVFLTVSLGTWKHAVVPGAWPEFLQVERGPASNPMGLKTFVIFLFSFPSCFIEEGTLKAFWEIGHGKRRRGPIGFVCPFQCGVQAVKEGDMAFCLSPLQWFFLKSKAFIRMNWNSIDLNW